MKEDGGKRYKSSQQAGVHNKSAGSMLIIRGPQSSGCTLSRLKNSQSDEKYCLWAYSSLHFLLPQERKNRKTVILTWPGVSHITTVSLACVKPTAERSHYPRPCRPGCLEVSQMSLGMRASAEENIKLRGELASLCAAAGVRDLKAQYCVYHLKKWPLFTSLQKTWLVFETAVC